MLDYIYELGYVLLIPAILLSFYASFKVRGTFNKFSTTKNKKGITGAEAARELLREAGITDVAVEGVAGHLTDHYDPRTKTLRLSESVYGSDSIAAVGVAAHEAGHAIQHGTMYSPLAIRNSILPAAGLGSNLSFPLIMIGLFISGMSESINSLSNILINSGIILFSLVVIFQVVTLPVEFNASNRAIAVLTEQNFLDDSEIKGAKKVLSAAALTYVAAVAVSLANLLRLLAMSRRKR